MSIGFHPQPKVFRVLLDSRAKKTARDANLRKMRAGCKAHAKGRCEIGLDHPGSETHHVIARSQGGPDTVENGAYVCHDHHRELTNHLLVIRGRTKTGRLRWERNEV